MISHLFALYQPQLRTFCNTEYGKWFLQDTFGGKIERQDKVVKITPNGFHLLKDWVKGKPIVEATFFPKNVYSNKFFNILTGLDILYANKQEQLIPRFESWKQEGFRNLFLTTTTFNPDADPEATSVDGNVARDVSPGTTNWAGIRDGAGTTSSDSYGTAVDTVILSGSVGAWSEQRRFISLFDTSSILPGGSVSSAVYSLYIELKSGGTGSALRMVTSSPASNTALTASDYGQLGTVAQATDIAWSSITTSSYNDWTLNATGLGNINVSGISKFGARADKDADNSEPASGWDVRVTNADAGSNKPKLVVTYTPGSRNSFLTVLLEI